jgi:PPM family protein phosphatase
VPFFKEIEHAALTDVGVKRSHNQDAYCVQKAPDRDHWQSVGHLFIVADGMGGHAVGEKASAKAVQEIPLTFVKQCAEEGPISALRKAFQEANAAINSIGVSNPEFRGLGTTATALVLRDEGAWIGHVGDSRAYRIRDGVVQQLSYDHSYAWEMARRLGIPPEELGDIKKNVIVRSLGPDPLVQVDIEGPYPLQDGDTFVLCSDGLSNLVPPDEIGAIVGSMLLTEAAKFLIELANLRGGPDNITVIVTRVGTTKDSYIGPKVSKTAKVMANLHKPVELWSKLIPWPITILLAGFVMAIGFIVFTLNNLDGAMVFFVGALLAIAIGLVGLFVHAKREKNKPVPVPEVPTRASVYRQYPVRIDAGLVERYTTLTIQLKEQLEAREWQVDWTAYKTHSDTAIRMLHDSDPLGAFRAQSRALLVLASSFNKHRPKEESFQPKWDMK